MASVIRLYPWPRYTAKKAKPIRSLLISERHDRLLLAQTDPEELARHRKDQRCGGGYRILRK